MKTFASNQLAIFPLKINNAAPPPGLTFTAASTENPPVASLAIGVVPAQTPPGPDDGLPAVVVTALHLAGGSGGFTVTDSNGDTAATDSFTITEPAAIEVDDPNVVLVPNPNPPTS